MTNTKTTPDYTVPSSGEVVVKIDQTTSTQTPRTDEAIDWNRNGNEFVWPEHARQLETALVTLGLPADVSMSGLQEWARRKAEELNAATAELEKARVEVVKLQTEKYGTPCSCETWIEACREAEEKLSTARAELEKAKAEVENLERYNDQFKDGWDALTKERDEAKAELTENEGVIAVWRGRTERAEAENEHLKSVLEVVVTWMMLHPEQVPPHIKEAFRDGRAVTGEEEKR